VNNCLRAESVGYCSASKLGRGVEFTCGLPAARLAAAIRYAHAPEGTMIWDRASHPVSPAKQLHGRADEGVRSRRQDCRSWSRAICELVSPPRRMHRGRRQRRSPDIRRSRRWRFYHRARFTDDGKPCRRASAPGTCCPKHGMRADREKQTRSLHQRRGRRCTPLVLSRSGDVLWVGIAPRWRDSPGMGPGRGGPDETGKRGDCEGRLQSGRNRRVIGN